GWSSAPSRTGRLGSGLLTGRHTWRATYSGFAWLRRRALRSSTSARRAFYRNEVLPSLTAHSRTDLDQGCGARTVDETVASTLQDKSTLADKRDSLRASWRTSCGCHRSLDWASDTSPADSGSGLPLSRRSILTLGTCCCRRG